MQIYVVIFTSFQCFTTLLSLGIVCGYMSLVTTLITVACSQFDELKSAILDIRLENNTPQHRQEDEQVHTILNCDLQAQLNVCIRKHQNIIE
jgi:hypothetical protein